MMIGVNPLRNYKILTHFCHSLICLSEYWVDSSRFCISSNARGGIGVGEDIMILCFTSWIFSCLLRTQVWGLVLTLKLCSILQPDPGNFLNNVLNTQNTSNIRMHSVRVQSHSGATNLSVGDIVEGAPMRRNLTPWSPQHPGLGPHPAWEHDGMNLIPQHCVQIC